MSTGPTDVTDRFEVDDQAAWPPLLSGAGVARVTEPVEQQLVRTYLDTPDRRLTKAGITLCRSDGTVEWVGPERAGSEAISGAHGPDGPIDPPAAVRAWVRDRQLEPIATLHVHQAVRLLLGADGEQLGTVRDRRVTVDAPAPSGWREWTLARADGSDEIAERVAGALRDAGARVARSPELRRALAAASPAGSAARPAAPAADEAGTPPDDSAPPRPSGPARDVLLPYIKAQVNAIMTRDAGARHDEPDAVHKMRVGTRRLRSALSTFRPMVDRAVTDPLRAELKWLATELGGARDAEVLRARLIDELAGQPDKLVLGEVGARIESDLRADHARAHAELVDALDSDRYFRLLDRLDDLVEQPPFTARADKRADKVITGRVRQAFKNVRKLVRHLPAADEVVPGGGLDAPGGGADAPDGSADGGPGGGVVGPGGGVDEHYHEIRKAAKKLRYAAEAASPAFGEPAEEFAKAAEHLQEVLGEHQDSVVAREALRTLGIRLFQDGQNAFTIGRLHASEETRAEAAIAEFEPAWQRLSAKKLRKWLH